MGLCEGYIKWYVEALIRLPGTQNAPQAFIIKTKASY